SKTLNFILFLLLISGFSLQAQPSRTYETNPDRKRANIWYFGQNAGIDFNTRPPTALTNGKVNTWEGCSSICDTAGNLLLYTDGRTVWDSNHNIVNNGTGLLGDQSSTQTALILHHPDNDSNYYILTTPYAYNYYTGARYNLVNAIKNTVSKKNIILHNNSSEKITAINHQNGRDIWIIGHEFGSNKFFINLLTKDGINECGSIQGIGTSLGNDELNNQGQIKTSSDGSYLAICHNTGMKVEVYYFNNRN